MTPEEEARQEIDRLLDAVSWQVQDYEELMQRDKASLDIFWLKDESLEDSDNLPEPEVLAAEIVENLEAALEQFKSIYEELGKDQTLSEKK
jgi:type I restriction enzyme M protein